MCTHYGLPWTDRNIRMKYLMICHMYLGVHFLHLFATNYSLQMFSWQSLDVLTILTGEMWEHFGCCIIMHFLDTSILSVHKPLYYSFYFHIFMVSIESTVQ